MHWSSTTRCHRLRDGGDEFMRTQTAGIAPVCQKTEDMRHGPALRARPYNRRIASAAAPMMTPDDPSPDTPPAHELVERLDAMSSSPDTVQTRSGPELNVGIVLWPRFPLLSLGGLCDALRHAADRSDQSRPLRCVWTTLGAPGGTVESSCGIAIPVQSVFPDV